MLDHQGQISTPTTATVSYSLSYDAVDVMDNDYLALALKAQIQISMALIGMVRRPSKDLIVLAKRWGITPDKAQKTFQATTQRGIRTMLHPSLLRRFRTND